MHKRLVTLGALAATASMLLPCAATSDTQAKAEVSARELSHATRLVFSWDGREKVPFTIANDGNRIILHFQKPVALRWGKALKGVSPTIESVETKQNGAIVVLTLKRTAEGSHFLGNDEDVNAEDRNGLEINPARTPRALAATPEPAETDMPPAVRTDPVMAVHEGPLSTLRHHAKPARATIAAREKHPAHPVRAAQATANTPQAAPKMTEIGPLPPVLPPNPVVMPQPLQAEDSPPAQLAEAAPALPLTESSLPPPVPLQALPAEPAKGLAALSPAAGEAASQKESLTLPLNETDPLAVFTRGRTLWVVAPKGRQLSPSSFTVQGAGLTGDIRSIPSDKAAVFMMPLNGNFSASVQKGEDQGMRIDIRSGPGALSQPLTPSLSTDVKNQMMFTIPSGKAEDIVKLTDPATGESLQVAPLPSPGTGVATGRSFTQFILLPSAQGIAVQTLADDVTVTLHKGMFEVASPKGLAISPDVAQQIKDVQPEMEAALAHMPTVLFPYLRWKLDDDKNLVPVERKLFHDVAYGAMEAADQARMRLLGIYLSEGLFPEAHGMADDILRTSLRFYRAHKISAMRGASYFFMYRLNEAERNFSAPELNGDPEAMMWLTLCRELLGEGSERFNFVANYDRYIRYYPPVFIQKLAIIAADRAITRKDYETANSVLDVLRRDNLDEPVRKYSDYIHAQVLSETNNEDEAEKIWEKQAADVDDTLIRARAEFSLVNMLLREEKITPQDAIRRLEKLRIVWRGDNLELSVLTLLGSLYIEEKQYGNALHTLRDIVLYYPDMPDAVIAARKMEETFVALYNKGGADAMPPLEALSLFYEFRDLVPIGRDGDLMIRNLADRLVNIDLLDRAALLLDHQIRNRLQGDERSRVGARLALIYLLNHQPKKALDILKTTGYGDLPPDLQLTRIRLTAQALAQQGQAQKAIDVLVSDTSVDGTLLRLSIYWENKDWSNVVATAEEVLGNRNDPSAALTPQESDVLLKLATAYVYEHDTGQIQYLRDYFTPLLKNSPNKDSFLFITSESGSIDYENLANLDQDISAVKTFLDTYRDKVKKNGLSNSL